MIYILTLVIFSGGSVAIATAEYNSAAACEAAKTIDEKAVLPPTGSPWWSQRARPKDRRYRGDNHRHWD